MRILILTCILSSIVRLTLLRSRIPIRLILLGGVLITSLLRTRRTSCVRRFLVCKWWHICITVIPTTLVVAFRTGTP